ncbi:hypothetical protein RGQ29_014371 [Quercus rubra]|uniref:non-specific serine/threonine protein kinase n=1 Tax=Quercus rubra TaxID=3512 RepID=A0AAN7FMB0_QUERU|nr:hypothetical protein RGQ29_014371 [Quercus rubra]
MMISVCIMVEKESDFSHQPTVPENIIRTQSSARKVGGIDSGTETEVLLSFKILGTFQTTPFLVKFLLSFGHLTSLQHIILMGNIINGTIPISLSHCRRLERLMFQNNKLTGHLPRELGRLHRLKFLDVSMNNLTGVIPSTFGNLSTLSVLNIARTQISGKIPNELGRLNNLVTLQLSENQLSGEIPFSIFNISSLKFLSLTLNRLVGKLPSKIGLTLPKIRELCLASNHLEGPIPSSLSNASYIEHLDLSSNNFTGHIPLLGNLKHLVQLLLGANIFDSLTNCTLLRKILLNSNQLAGELPPSVTNLSVNLQHFIGKYQNLVSLSIEKNFFKGKIPNSIGKLQKLERLMVTDNLFSGEIPDIFSNLTWLYELDMANNRLSGRIPMSIATCQRLEMLVLQRTALNGSIPKQIFELPQLKFLLYSILQQLNIARNRITGSIPKSLENLAALESLDLSANNLSGLIPTELENLNALQMLNFWDSLQGNNQLCVFDRETAEKLRVTTLCAVITKKKRKTINNQSSSSGLKGLPPRLSYSEIQLATNGFDTTNLIGRGAFGSVYRAVFSTGESGIHTTVAVKVLDLTQSKASKSFVFTSCSSIDHTGAEFKALAMEFMSNGNLDKWLYPEDVECGSTLTLTQRLNIAIDVASALDYLHHDCDPPVVHCDLKPGNVLLDEDMTAHVGDFGLASTIGLKGSIGYIAPEYGLGGKASTSGDVYILGILLLEMMIAKKPTDGIFQEGLSISKFISEVHKSKILDIADPRLFKDNESFSQSSSTNYSSGEYSSSKNKNNIAFRGDECVASMVRVGLSCAADSSKERFTMREALSKLQEIKRLIKLL